MLETVSSIGKKRRLNNIFDPSSGRTIIVPTDDLLLFGPKGHLVNYKEKIRLLKNTPINAILGFPGFFKEFQNDLLDKAWIMNLSISTTQNQHTYKKLAFPVEHALSLGADAVAVHVNISSPYENEMIENLANVAVKCDNFGIPLMAIIYARKPGLIGDDNYLDLKQNDPDKYTELISHVCRIGVEVGADIIKTNYTGSTTAFKKVIESSGNVPVVIAGGPETSEENALIMVQDSITAGASGVCFGRNTFSRDNIPSFIDSIRSIVNI